MPDFSHLEKLDVQRDRIVHYVMYNIEGEPVLHIGPATEANRPYFNALLRKSRSTARIVKAKSMTAGVVEENREDDRILYAKHVVKGWTGIADKEGNEVPFTEENCLDFLKALPGWLFDDLRQYAGDTQNFLVDEMNTEEVAKNLESA